MKYRFVKWGSGKVGQGDRETGREWDRELVSYGNDTQCAHDGQETICEKFPVEMIHNGVMTRQETIREGFPMEMIRNGSMPGRKLFAKSFLWKWYTVCP